MNTAINRKVIEVAKLLNIYLGHFPKHEKFALANRIRDNVYEIFDLITEGNKKYFKKTTLTNLDIAHEKLRMQIFLAYELGYFAYKDSRKTDKIPEILGQHRYISISKQVDELGRMIGGWIKSIKEENRWK